MDALIPSLMELWQGLIAYLTFDTRLLADPEMLFRLGLQVVLLLGSAFFSGSETALFSLSRLDLQELRRRDHPQHANLHALLDQPRRLIISILCGNELINIAAVANMTGILVALYGHERAGVLSVAVMVPLLLLLGEITPKTIAVSNPVRVSAGLVAAPMRLWVKFIAPLRWLLRGVADRVTTRIVGGEKAPENILQLDEFRSIVEESASGGQLKGIERALIDHLLDAGTTEIVEILTPRTRVAFIDAEAGVEGMVARFREIRHSRVPVYRGHHDNLVGFLHIEDVMPLVLDKADLSCLTEEKLLRPPIVVPPTKKVDEMLDYFQEHRARAAVVLDEFGGVQGLVTLRDVLTYLFGHISGEVPGREHYQERDDNVYVVPGDMKLTDFDDLTNFGIWDPRMTTIAGFAFRHLDRMPRVGDKVTTEGFEITVLELDGQRIAKVRVARGTGESGEVSPPAEMPEATEAPDEAPPEGRSGP